ncbi:MAG: Gfo/Idh/MocA family oxidoreductase [Solobacterium sp.]|nr:Gfo/Idh/MocA family oxidoreductase [Solobacterium sp.]
MKLGIVGNGGIVVSALESIKETDIEATTLWCRNKDKGMPLCEKYAVKTIYTDYDAFLKDESYDVVYIGLINSLHYEYTKKALEAGRNVICEKPFTSTYKEAEELVALAKEKGVYLFEAIMSRYSENYANIRKNLDKVGELRLVQCNYSQYSRRYNSYKQGTVLPAFDPNLSGGALYDINVYNIHFTEGLFGKPEEVHYYANKGFNGIDTSGILVMKYPGFLVTCSGAKDSASVNGMMIQGDGGYIHVNSRPGMIRNITLYADDAEPKKLDIADDPNPMQTEFVTIAKLISEGNKEQMYKWLDDTLTVMEILQKARNDAGICFLKDNS